MNSHFRTAVLTVILAGGTLTSYAAAYAVMSGSPTSAAPTQSVVQQLPAGQLDISVREACSVFEGVGARRQCMREIAGAPRPVRVIDFASSDTASIIR